MANPVVHFEIMGGDPAAQHAFYSALFGWSVQDLGAEMGNYGTVDTNGGEGINGAVGAAMDGPSYTTVYVAVADPQATLDKAEQLGGKTVVPVTEIPGVVTFAMFSDRQGNKMGIVKDEPMPDGQQQGPSKGAGAPVAWFEIGSNDPKDARAFYADMFGWNPHSETEADYTYYEMHLDERGINGAISSSQDGTARVLVWVKVADLRGTLDKAASLGAKPAMEPKQVHDGLTIAGFIDAAGNFVGIYNGM